MKISIKILLILILFGVVSCSTQERMWGCVSTGGFDFKINISEFSYNLISNNLKIEGELLDSTSLETLIGVNVVVTAEDLKEITGTATDIEGKFKLSFKYDPDYIIKFSYIGYNSQTYNLKHFLQQYFEHQSDK